MCGAERVQRGAYTTGALGLSFYCKGNSEACWDTVVTLGKGGDPKKTKVRIPPCHRRLHIGASTSKS